MTQPVMTLALVQTNLSAWIAASTALADGRTFALNGRMLTLSNAAEVRDMIGYWQQLESSMLAAANYPQQSRGVALASFR